MPTNQPHKEYLELIAQEISKRLPDNHGFILLAVPYNSNDTERTINYVSNCQREDAIRLLTRFTAKMKGVPPAEDLPPANEILEAVDMVIEILDEGVAMSRKVFLESNLSHEQAAIALAKTCTATRQALRLLKEATK